MVELGSDYSFYVTYETGEHSEYFSHRTERIMDNIIKMVSEKTGITEAQAKVAVDTIVSILKEKMPAGIGTQVEVFVKGGAGSMDDMASGLKDKIGGVFGG